MWTRAALLAERLWRACNGVYCRHAPLSGLGANPDGAKAVPHVARSASSSFIAAASLFAAAVLGTVSAVLGVAVLWECGVATAWLERHAGSPRP